MSEKTVTLEKNNNIAIVTLNRPDNANTINLDLVKDLYEAFKDCHHDEKVRAVIFTGNGSMFSGGGDLSSFVAETDNLGPFITDMTTYFHLAVTLMHRMEKPIVVAINGTAAGGGLSLALSGDIIISSENVSEIFSDYLFYVYVVILLIGIYAVKDMFFEGDKDKEE